MSVITIVDYGMGNIGSILNMIKRVGLSAVVVSDIDGVENAEKLLLPGVGAFDAAMDKINSLGLRDVLQRKVLEDRIPLLGICLGMQLLMQSSEEGTLPGLGWIDAKVTRFPIKPELKVPHMGWNIATPVNDSPLTKDFDKEARFYFVHSYCVHVENQKNSIMKTSYGYSFDSVIQSNNIYGAQFHPEKSHRFGMKLFSNFASL